MHTILHWSKKIEEFVSEMENTLNTFHSAKHNAQKEEWESLCFCEDDLRLSLGLTKDSLTRLISNVKQTGLLLKQQRVFEGGQISQHITQMTLSSNTLLNHLRSIHTYLDRFLVKRGYLKSDAGFLFFPPRSDDPFTPSTQRCLLFLQELEMKSKHAMDFANLIGLDLLTFHIELEKIRVYIKEEH